MVEQTSSLWERLKACYHILTKDNYVVFCINNNHIVWNEDGTYNRIKVNYPHLKEGDFSLNILKEESTYESKNKENRRNSKYC